MKRKKDFEETTHTLNSEPKLKIIKRGLIAEGTCEICGMHFGSHRLTAEDAEGDILLAFKLHFCGG